MNKKHNHSCKICGKTYYACPKCDELQNWRAFCDTSEHYQIFQILLLYGRNLIPVSEAAAMLRYKLNGVDMSAFLQSKQDEISKILALDAPKKPRRGSEDNEDEEGGI